MYLVSENKRIAAIDTRLRQLVPTVPQSRETIGTVYSCVLTRLRMTQSQCHWLSDRIGERLREGRLLFGWFAEEGSEPDTAVLPL